MKNKLLMLAAACFVMFAACNKPSNAPEEKLDVSLEVSGIQDNEATISLTLNKGVFRGGKIVEAVRVSDLTFDVDNDIELAKYVRENGVVIEALPYESTLTKIKLGSDIFTAAIFYNAEGRVVLSVSETWTPEGKYDGWSNENNPGELGEIVWK